MSTPSTPRFGAEDAAAISPVSQRNPHSFTRPQSSGRLRSRRESTSSVISSYSIGSGLETTQRLGDTVREASPYSIAALLQPPIVRTGLLPYTQASAAASGYRAPTTRDIPPVTLTNIPQVPPETFSNYLSQIEPLYEQFRRFREDRDTNNLARKDPHGEQSEDASLYSREDEVTSPVISRNNSFASTLETPTKVRRRSSGHIRRNRNEPTPLSTIPNVYFEEDFHLENPRTFDIVSERAEIVRAPPGLPAIEVSNVNGAPTPPRKSLATNAILQEKLSWYMDTVEVHLINNISTASAGFFTALGSLRDLQNEAAQSVAKIQSLRQDLKRLDEEIALGGLEIASQKRRAANIRKLSSAVSQIQDVVEGFRKADECINSADYVSAADQMDQVACLMCGTSICGQSDDSLIDLRTLQAFQGLEPAIQDLRRRIGEGFVQKFISILITDLRQHIERIDRAETLKRWSRQRGIPPTYMEVNDGFRKEVLAALEGLQRSGHLAQGTTAYRETVTKEVKSLIRKHLPSSTDDDAESMVSTSTGGGRQYSQQEKSSILARNLRGLDPQDAELLLSHIYTSISEALRRVSTQIKVVLDVTSSIQPTTSNVASPSRSSTAMISSPILGSDIPQNVQSPTRGRDEVTQVLDMSSLTGQAVDTAQTQITRVLKVRNEQSIRLPKDLFLRYMNLNRQFADECEAVSGRGGQTIRGLINTQILSFVQTLGSTETERIANRLDQDGWDAVDFKESDDVLLQQILSSMTSDPVSWTQGSHTLWDAPNAANEVPSTNGTSELGTPAATNGKAGTKGAYIDHTRYLLVPSAISLLGSIDNMLSLTVSVPSLTTAIANSLLEVLRTFNSRSCQLILGAGAVRTAGLKNITTKHLALASQALSFVTALTPYMRECVRRHLSPGTVNILAEFDKTKRLFQEHQSGIHEKLVEIMISRCQAHVKAMRLINFDDIHGTEEKPSPYMETLTKETLTLHRVLGRHLNEVDLRMIVRQIAAGYKEQWTKAFGEASAQSKEGESRLLRDAECFNSRLGKIEGFDAIGKEILAVVKAKISDQGETVSSAKDTQIDGSSSADTKLNGPAEPSKALTSEREGDEKIEVSSTTKAVEETTNESKTNETNPVIGSS